MKGSASGPCWGLRPDPHYMDSCFALAMKTPELFMALSMPLGIIDSWTEKAMYNGTAHGDRGIKTFGNCRTGSLGLCHKFGACALLMAQRLPCRYSVRRETNLQLEWDLHEWLLGLWSAIDRHHRLRVILLTTVSSGKRNASFWCRASSSKIEKLLTNYTKPIRWEYLWRFAWLTCSTLKKIWHHNRILYE